MHPIHPLLVELLDALNSKAPVETLRREWLGVSASLREQVSDWSDFASSPEEQETLGELPSRLAALDQAVTGTDPEALLEAALVFFSRFDTVRQAREKVYVIALKPIDDLVLACRAVANSLGQPEAIFRRISAAQTSVSDLKNLFRPSAASFPLNFGMEMESGFHSFDKAFSALEQYRSSSDASDLSQALEHLKAGVRSANVFLKAISDTQQQSQLSIPVIGGLLQDLKMDPSAENLERLRRQGIPAYEKMWDETDDGWLLPPGKVEKLLGQVEREFEAFKTALGGFEQQPAVFWQAVDRLEAAFSAVRSNSMLVDKVLNSPLGPEAALVLGLLDGSAPEIAAQNAIEGIRAGDVPPFIEDMADDLEEYLKKKDPYILLGILEDLIAEVSEH